MGELLVGKSIVKVFGKEDKKNMVLDHVSVSMNEGEFVAIMGPSGSGKSTLMYALSQMDTIDSGEVRFEGKQITTMKEKELADLRRHKMGFIFQQPTFLRNLNLLDNIILPMMRDHKKEKQQLVEKAKKLMQQTGISGLEEREITEVSGGQLQRAGICRALMNAPKIIFGDEPTGALNSRATAEIMGLLQKIHEEGTAILLVTHDAKVAARAQRVLFMKDGQLVHKAQLGTYEEAQLMERVAHINEQMKAIGV